jgi:predicted nucleic acid-binding protein
MVFIDTNIFLRHLLKDDETKAEACLALFKQIEAGRLTAWTSDLTIAELVFVLSAKRPNSYGFTRQQVSDALLPLLSLHHLHYPAKGLLPRIFELYTTTPMDFIDAYHIALVEQSGHATLYSYDRHFDRISLVQRLKP